MEMASDNQVTIVGNLTDDPELRYTPNGAAVAKFRVAVSPRFKDENGQWKDGDTSYFSVSAWRALAENAAESLTRGTRVVVTGRLKQRSWESQEGEERSAIEGERPCASGRGRGGWAASVKWATAKVEKTRRAGGSGAWNDRVTVGAGARS